MYDPITEHTIILNRSISERLVLAPDESESLMVSEMINPSAAIAVPTHIPHKSAEHLFRRVAIKPPISAEIYRAHRAVGVTSLIGSAAFESR